MSIGLEFDLSLEVLAYIAAVANVSNILMSQNISWTASWTVEKCTLHFACIVTVYHASLA